MNPAAYPFAPLGSRLIRRAGPTWDAPAIRILSSAPTLRDDLRFFAASWAAGFLFFLAYLA